MSYYMKRNKRGFLLGEETVKLIVAVISILFLILFIVFLYNNFSKNRELDQAKSSLESLIMQIESKSTSAEVYNPTEWAIVSFSGENLPDKCSQAGWENCLCICDPALSNTNSKLACNSKGICKENDFEIIGDNDAILSLLNAKFGLNLKLELEGIIITPPLIVSINQDNKTIQRMQ